MTIEITDDLISIICAYIEEGNSFENAYLLAAIPASTGHKWRSLGRKSLETDPSCAHSRFYQLTSEAKAQYISTLVGRLNVASTDTDNWQAAMTILERRDPIHYSKHSAVEDGFEIDTTKPLTDQIMQVLKGFSESRIDVVNANYLAQIISSAANVSDKTDAKEMLCEILKHIKETTGGQKMSSQ